MFPTSNYTHFNSLSPIVSPIERSKAYPNVNSSPTSSSILAPTSPLLAKEDRKPSPSSTPLVFIKGTFPQYNTKPFTRPKVKLVYPITKPKKNSPLPASKELPTASVSNAKSESIPFNTKPQSRHDDELFHLQNPSTPTSKHSTYTKNVKLNTAFNSKHVIINPPVDILKEMSEKLQYYKSENDARKAKFLLQWSRLKSKKKVDGKKKRMENQKIEIINKTRILEEMKLRYHRLMTLHEELKSAHKVEFDELNSKMTGLLSQVEDFDSKLSVILEEKRKERETVKLEVMEFEDLALKILNEKRNDLEQRENDLQELTRVIQELHLLKVQLLTSPDFLRESLTPLIQERTKLEEKLSEDLLVLKQQLHWIKDQEDQKMYKHLKNTVDITSNKVLKNYFHEFTVPLYSVKKRLSHELEVQKCAQDTVLASIQELEDKIRKFETQPSMDPKERT